MIGTYSKRFSILFPTENALLLSHQGLILE